VTETDVNLTVTKLKLKGNGIKIGFVNSIHCSQDYWERSTMLLEVTDQVSLQFREYFENGLVGNEIGLYANFI
jgi:hypothetical protein